MSLPDTVQASYPKLKGNESEFKPHSNERIVGEKYAGLTAEEATEGSIGLLTLVGVTVKCRERTQLQALEGAPARLRQAERLDNSKERLATIRTVARLFSRRNGTTSSTLVAHVDGRLALKQTVADRVECKNHNGFERIGTKPSMALPLLENQGDDTLKRIRRHGLESLIWIFAWILRGDKFTGEWSWDCPSSHEATQNKIAYWRKGFFPDKYHITIKRCDEVFWNTLCTVWYRWDNLATREKFFQFRAPEDEFVQIFDQGFPREPEYRNWDWATFKSSRT